MYVRDMTVLFSVKILEIAHAGIIYTVICKKMWILCVKSVLNKNYVLC